MAVDTPPWEQGAADKPPWEGASKVGADSPPWEAAPAVAAKKKPSAFMEGVKDIGALAPVSGAITAATGGAGFVAGGLAGLAGVVENAVSQAVGRTPRLDPAKMQEATSEALTYKPSPRGEKYAAAIAAPFELIGQAGRFGGEAAEKAGAPPLVSAGIETAIAGPGYILGPKLAGKAIGAAHEATMPKFTGREALTPKPGAFQQPFEGVERPPTTGTSSGVPLKLDKLIAEAQQLVQPPPAWTKGTAKEVAEAGKPTPQQGQTPLEQTILKQRIEDLQPPAMRQYIAGEASQTKVPPVQGQTPLERSIAGAKYDWQIPPPPDIKGTIRDIKAAGPQPGQAKMELEPPPAGTPRGASTGWELNQKYGVTDGAGKTVEATYIGNGTRGAVFEAADGTIFYPREGNATVGQKVPTTRPGIEETVKTAAGELDRPPAPDEPPWAPAGRGGGEQPYVGAFEREKQEPLPFRKYDPDKEYPVRPIVIPRSEVRGGAEYSGGKGRKVYELVQTNTPLERSLANAGRAWETDVNKDITREELSAAVRQMSEEDAARFGALRGLPDEKLVEAAKQYWASIRTDLKNARQANPEATSVQIEAPDAERAIFFGRDKPGEAPPGRAATADLTLDAPEGQIGAPPSGEWVGGKKVQPADAPEIRESIIAMRDEIGAKETGGKLLIDETTRATTPGTGEVLGRTPWVGSQWWFERPVKLSEKEALAAIDKYERGEKLGKRERDFIEYARYEVEDRINIDREGLSPEELADKKALDEFGPGTLGMNPMAAPGLVKDALDAGIKKTAGFANAIQKAPESAKPAIAPLFDYARSIQAAKETAQRDVIEGDARAADIRADHAKSMRDALAANPRFQTVKPQTMKEAAREIERAKREIAAAKLRRWLLDEGYAIRRHSEEMPGTEDIYREPTQNLRDLHDTSGRSLLLREDIIPLAEQMVGAHDIAQQRAYSKSWVGRAESVNHATVSWLMQNPLFHLVTTAGKATAYTVPVPGRTSLLNYLGTASEAIKDRAVFADMVQHGFQPFPVRAKMEPTGAEAGAFQRTLENIGATKPYEMYQWMHRHILADSVNKIQGAFYQMRLEQLVKQAQKRGETITQEAMDTMKTTAAQESNPIGGNLPREEMNQTLYRALGLGLFSRGLQASTTRMLTRTIENNEIVRSVAKKNGYTEAEAKVITDRNRNFLMAGLLLDYAVMQSIANGLNYATTSMYDEPDKEGKTGGHFVWDNPGSTKASILFPNSIFLYPKTDDKGERTGEGVYISNPVRTVRDIIEYAMIPFEIGGGTKPQVLFNKFSPLANLGKGVMSGTDWAGRPLGGPGDVAAETASMGMPAPMGDLPRYAIEAARADNFSFVTEGIKKMFEPEMAIPVLLGMQPRVSSKDPTTTQEAAEQSAEEKKLWARVSRVKQLSKRIEPDVREEQIKSVLDEARKLHMSGSKIGEIARVMRQEGVSKAQRGAAGRGQARKEEAREGQLEAPPEL